MDATKTIICWPYYDRLPIGREVEPSVVGEYAECKSSCSILVKSHSEPIKRAVTEQRQSGATHLAICHADILPQLHWLDALHAELAATGVDVLSVLMPKKEDSGETSTAIECVQDGKLRRRLLTMREAATLPETFTAADLNPDGWLLVNTGLLLARLDRPWWREIAWHHYEHRDVSQEPPLSDYETEDWCMSRQLHIAGAQVACTRKIAAGHRGTFDYPNQGAWGRIERHDWTDSHSIVPGIDPNYHAPGVSR